MKHLPNLLTLGNLFCGCMAIAYSLTALPYYTFKINAYGPPSYEWVYGVRQLYFAGIFIVLGAVCDLLDGFTARALKVFSPIGKDLDSLADVVTFGVAPSMIMFQLLWDAQMGEKNAFDVGLIAMAPAFLLACFAALRLAKFNITADTQKNHFIGMPTPAVGLLVATFPLIIWLNPKAGELFKNKWAIYLVITLLCWLMVSKIRFIKLLPAKKSLRTMWPQITIIVTAMAVGFLFGILAAPIVFAEYVVLSIIYRSPTEDDAVPTT